VRQTPGATVKDRGFLIVAIPGDEDFDLAELNVIRAAEAERKVV
jgi:hypothetical protein